MFAQRAFAIGSLAVLSAVGAELLAAYNDTTGRPLALLGNLVFFALLYGCPALLIRELARRTGRGWATMLMLAAAAGLIQAGLLDQSLFAERYDGVRGWEASFRATALPPLGVSAYMLQGFLLGHVVFSFCAPIALVEAMCPSLAGRPWLGRAGLVVTVDLWLLIAVAIFADAGRASPAELAVTAAVVVALLIVALRAHGPARRARTPTPRPEAVLAAGFVAATLHALMPDTWAGTAGALLVAGAAAVALARAARGSAWGLRHGAALATGVLLSRGVLAFTYFPVVGHTPAVAKYAHNVGMLLLVITVGVCAGRRSADQLDAGAAYSGGRPSAGQGCGDSSHSGVRRTPPRHS
jgi:hypothetical protein